MSAIGKKGRLPFRGGCVYGLTGNPGAGKSTVALLLQEKGAQVLNADALGHTLLQKDSPILDDLIREFGESIRDAEGGVARQRLGEIVFADETRLARLNELVHPPLLQLIRRHIDLYRESPGTVPLFLDAALIFEWKINPWLDKVIVVSAPVETRRRRFEALRSGAASLFEKREAAQLPSDYKEMHADAVIRNNGSMDDLRRQMVDIFIE